MSGKRSLPQVRLLFPAVRSVLLLMAATDAHNTLASSPQTLCLTLSQRSPGKRKGVEEPSHNVNVIQRLHRKKTFSLILSAGLCLLKLTQKHEMRQALIKKIFSEYKYLSIFIHSRRYCKGYLNVSKSEFFKTKTKNTTISLIAGRLSSTRITQRGVIFSACN